MKEKTVIKGQKDLFRSELQSIIDTNHELVLLANKTDLSNKLEEQEIISLGKRIKAEEVLFTSAKTGDNVELAFSLISQHAI